jgi:hypothetical protein
LIGMQHISAAWYFRQRYFLDFGHLFSPHNQPTAYIGNDYFARCIICKLNCKRSVVRVRVKLNRFVGNYIAIFSPCIVLWHICLKMCSTGLGPSPPIRYLCIANRWTFLGAFGSANRVLRYIPTKSQSAKQNHKSTMRF